MPRNTENARAAELRRLQRRAIRSEVRMVRHASASAFVRCQVARSPLAERFAQADDSTRASLLPDVATVLRGRVDDAGVAFPIEGHIAVAKK